MRYQQNVQVQLQERYRRLYKAHSTLFSTELGYMLDFIRSTPVLAAIVDRVEKAAPDFDPSDWNIERGGSGPTFPPNEVSRAKLVWCKMQEWAEDSNAGPMFGLSLDRTERNLDAGARVATEQMVEPFVEFLQEALGRSSDTLYLLERYARRVEWFDRDELWAKYRADTARGEALYDAHLRSFLFDQGIENPFSQPRSASGSADVVADLETESSLVCEVKLFDGDSYGKSYVAKGFRQAVEYALDYGDTSAFLVVFDLSEKKLELPSEGELKDWPPRVSTQGVTVFMVRVRARPMPSASKMPKLPLVSLTIKDLVGVDDR